MFPPIVLKIYDEQKMQEETTIDQQPSNFVFFFQ